MDIPNTYIVVNTFLIIQDYNNSKNVFPIIQDCILSECVFEIQDYTTSGNVFLKFRITLFLACLFLIIQDYSVSGNVFFIIEEYTISGMCFYNSGFHSFGKCFLII